MALLFAGLDALVPVAKRRAAQDVYDGEMCAASQRYIGRCSHQLWLSPIETLNVIFTRDVGHHSNGWWKNPDFERCRHLSLSFVGMGPMRLPFDRNRAAPVVRAFLGDDASLAWVEGPYSAEGKAADVWHYRVFVDKAWRALKPRGEVYDRRNTPADWRSFSETHGFTPHTEQAPFLLATSD